MLSTGASPSWEEKSSFAQLLKKLSIFYRTRRFIVMFTRALYWILTWATWIQPIHPHSIYLRSILILSSNIRLGLHYGLFTSGFITKTLCIPLLVLRATRPAHLIIFDFIILIIFGLVWEAVNIVNKNFRVCGIFHDAFNKSDYITALKDATTGE
jgi:hypothetical protein